MTQSQESQRADSKYSNDGIQSSKSTKGGIQNDINSTRGAPNTDINERISVLT